MTNKNWEKRPTELEIKKVVKSLEANGFEVELVKNGERAKEKVLELIPKNAEVMTMTSKTLDTISVTEEINESGEFNSVKKKLMEMDRDSQGLEMNRLGSAAEFAIGSVHAITQDGKILVASNSGSQLPGYVYGAEKVILVVSIYKIVKDLDNGFKRIYEYTLPLENERMQGMYGMNSFVSKLLIMNREPKPGRTTIILVDEKLGF